MILRSIVGMIGYVFGFIVLVGLGLLLVNSFFPILLPNELPPETTAAPADETPATTNPCPVEGDVKVCVWKYGYEVCKCYPEGQ